MDLQKLEDWAKVVWNQLPAFVVNAQHVSSFEDQATLPITCM